MQKPAALVHKNFKGTKMPTQGKTFLIFFYSCLQSGFNIQKRKYMKPDLFIFNLSSEHQIGALESQVKYTLYWDESPHDMNRLDSVVNFTEKFEGYME